ncbi:succinic semialdehyde dehydrogenase [Geodermatophilus sp. TF02-6]|uniref:succinic semialdehyde dehydrogenase n=1 Tax=Geodermatophilus sp. TF02-6 TaxID=2250575 RepID=UPI000DE80210|nr:succinic semialdehyde dehydrogenase [Geodermatophilus sp. TF02-6]RBY79546.1 succinic semialdehyde dehydrogenase [Geodermatophilus sp. TF02-6]
MTTAADRLDAGLLTRLATLVTAAPGRPRQSSRAPFDGSPVGEVPTCTADDVREAQRRARAAQAEWAARPVADRCRVALRFCDLVVQRRNELMDVLQVETGKARVSAFEEVVDVARSAGYAARSAARHLRSERRRGALPGLTRPVVHRRPKGLVGVVSPWDTPMALAVSDAVPALLGGNGVVLKPDAQTPFSALAAVDLLVRAGLPRELLGVVTGRGSVLGAPLVDGVDHLVFTGSTATGRTVAERCGRRLVSCSAELGGKNPMLVLADADLDRAVEGAVRGCFSNGGQLCMHLERLYVEDAVYDRFVPALAERTRRIRLGGGFGWDAEMGSLANRAQFDVVTRHVADAVAAGARVLAGGRPRPDLGPLFHEPTLLEGVGGDVPVAREETFGPVATVTRVRDADEAVRRANDTPYGLNASVWSTPRRGAAVAAGIRAGTVNVNEGYAAAWASHDAPMGGMGDSGLGRRHGREGILAVTEAQTVAVQRGLPLGPLPGMPLDRYARVMTAALRLLRRVPVA